MKNGKMNGKGKITFPDGRSYEGKFKNGELDGEIICFENNKQTKGLFVNGQFEKYL